MVCSQVRPTQIVIRNPPRATLIRFTAFLPASLVVLEAIMYLVFKDDYYYMCLGAITSKVYTVSLLSLLNSRMRMRNSNDSAYLWDSEEPPINHATQSIGITFAIMPTSTIAEIGDGASLTMFSSDRIDGIDRIASVSLKFFTVQQSSSFAIIRTSAEKCRLAKRRMSRLFLAAAILQTYSIIWLFDFPPY